MDSHRSDTRRAHRSLAASIVAAALLALAAPPARSATYVIPHVLEQQGTTSTTQFRFDHNLRAFYGSGLAGTPAGTGALLSLYLYDNSAGSPLQNNGQDVCNPCTFSIGPPVAPRKTSILVENLILARGAFDSPVKLGFGVIVVEGDPAGVSLETNIVNSHSSAFDVSMLSVAPSRLRSEDPGAPSASVFQLSHVLEASGKISNTQYTFDQTIYATYTAGLAGTPAGAGATLDLYLFDNTGDLPLQNQGSDVCNPCSYALGGANPRKRTITIDDLIIAQGAFDSPVKLGSAILVVTGDPGNVTLQAFTNNSHTSAFDLTMSSPPLQPVQVGGALSVLLEPRPGAVARLSASPNPASGEVRFAIEMTRAADVEMSIFDVAGRRVATVFEGRLQAGASECRWNGASTLGKLEGGVYFARLTSADGSSLARVVMRP